MKKLLTTCLVLFQLVAAPLLVVAQTGSTSGSPAVLYFAPPGESSTTGNVSINSANEFSVDVKVNTHEADSAGADVIVTYTTTQVQYVRGSMPGSGSGSFYPTVVKGAPTSNTTGRIAMARVIQAPDEGSLPAYTKGDGVFATLTFKALATNPIGTTVNLGFEYQSGSTTDSNVAGTTTSNPDILGGVTNATLTLQATSDTGFSSVDLTPATATVVPYGNQTLTATAKDASGGAITSGVTYSWTVSGPGVLSASTGSSVTFTSNSATSGSANVTVTATKDSVSKTDSSVITIGGGQPGADPTIDHIVPGQGDEDANVEVEIYGSNFGSDDGRVYIGSRLADIISWGDGKIVVLVPQVNVSRDTEYQVKVRRNDGAEARYMGYTYLDKTGLPLLPWLIMFPLNGAAAVFAKKRWFKKK